jgi:hypothetical protein
MSLSEIAAEAFLAKCRSLPLDKGELGSINLLASYVRSGQYEYDPAAAVLTTKMRIRICDDGQFLLIDPI